VNSIEELYQIYQAYDLLVDSRRLTDPSSTLFFALPGQRVDGHDFIPELLKAGVRHFVVTEQYQARPQVQAKVETEQGGGAPVFHQVPDPLALLQKLAAHHRQQFDVPVLAITGSNGKTIVKDWLVQLLGHRFNVCASPRSFNSQIGVPLSVWRLRAEHDLAIFEAGVSKKGEMARLAEIIRPACGLFTMLGSAHDAGFPDRPTKHQEKLSLFKGAEWVAVSADDNDSIRLLRMAGIDPLTFLGIGGRLLEVEEVPLKLNFPDLPGIYLENAYAAVAGAYGLGLPPAEIRRHLPGLRPLSNRLEQREGRNGGIVINDSYSNDLSALAAALEFAAAQNPFPGLTLILGTLQPGSFNLPGTGVRAENPALLQLLEGSVTRLVTVGKTNVGLPAEQHFTTPEDLLEAIGSDLKFGAETILVKGASVEQLDRVADVLSRKQHQTLLRLDLAALRHNFQTYRQSVSAGMIVMVKASAYGGGALPVARALAAAGADYLAVAYPDEGRSLREGGVKLPIMVLNAEPGTFPRCVSDGLEPVVHQVGALRRARAYGLKVHLELDTGMARLGFQTNALDDLLEELEREDYTETIASVFTHLAASEEAAHDEFTRQQLADFDSAYARISTMVHVAPPRHVLNSNGISRFPDRAYEMVRLGIGLYGIGDATRGGELRPALQLLTHITRVYDRPAGDSVGYGRKGRLDRPSRIAVLPLGYADGLPRLAGEGKFSVRIGEHLAPIIGAVCMDMTTVDVTDLPGYVSAGTEVTIFGASHSIELLAEAAQTIPYEILTGIGSRVHRIYSQD
jgi:alanine racemase